MNNLKFELLAVELRQAINQFEKTYSYSEVSAVEKLNTALVPFIAALSDTKQLKLYHMPPFQGKLYMVKSEQLNGTSSLVFEAYESYSVNHRILQYSAVVTRHKAILKIIVRVNQRLIARRSLSMIFNDGVTRFFETEATI